MWGWGFLNLLTELALPNLIYIYLSQSFKIGFSARYNFKICDSKRLIHSRKAGVKCLNQSLLFFFDTAFDFYEILNVLG